MRSFIPSRSSQRAESAAAADSGLGCLSDLLAVPAPQREKSARYKRLVREDVAGRGETDRTTYTAQSARVRDELIIAVLWARCTAVQCARFNHLHKSDGRPRFQVVAFHARYGISQRLFCFVWARMASGPL
jgi:hypothetical protein